MTIIGLMNATDFPNKAARTTAICRFIADECARVKLTCLTYDRLSADEKNASLTSVCHFLDEINSVLSCESVVRDAVRQ